VCSLSEAGETDFSCKVRCFLAQYMPIGFRLSKILEHKSWPIAATFFIPWGLMFCDITTYFTSSDVHGTFYGIRKGRKMNRHQRLQWALKTAFPRSELAGQEEFCLLKIEGNFGWICRLCPQARRTSETRKQREAGNLLRYDLMSNGSDLFRREAPHSSAQVLALMRYPCA
jgi:hypothetical protein